MRISRCVGSTARQQHRELALTTLHQVDTEPYLQKPNGTFMRISESGNDVQTYLSAQWANKSPTKIPRCDNIRKSLGMVGSRAVGTAFAHNLSVNLLEVFLGSQLDSLSEEQLWALGAAAALNTKCKKHKQTPGGGRANIGKFPSDDAIDKLLKQGGNIISLSSPDDIQQLRDRFMEMFDNCWELLDYFCVPGHEDIQLKDLIISVFEKLADFKLENGEYVIDPDDSKQMIQEMKDYVSDLPVDVLEAFLTRVREARQKEAQKKAQITGNQGHVEAAKRARHGQRAANDRTNTQKRDAERPPVQPPTQPSQQDPNYRTNRLLEQLERGERPLPGEYGANRYLYQGLPQNRNFMEPFSDPYYDYADMAVNNRLNMGGNTEGGYIAYGDNTLHQTRDDLRNHTRQGVPGYDPGHRLSQTPWVTRPDNSTIPNFLRNLGGGDPHY